VGHFPKRSAKAVFFRQTHQEQVAISQNNLEQIVEIVRNASGQCRDGFHLLGLEELCSQSPAFRPVGKKLENGGLSKVINMPWPNGQIEYISILAATFNLIMGW